MQRDGFAREVLGLALPAFGALVAPSVLIATDSAFVGTLGTNALAGLAAAGAIFGTAVGLSYFLAYATTSVVARRFGAGQIREAIGDGINYITLGLILGAACAAALWAFAAPLCAWIGASPEVLPLAVDWLRAAAIGAPAIMASMATVGLFRGLQNTRITFIVTSTQVTANIVLAAWFIFGARMGMFGAGLAVAIAESLGLVLYLIVLMRHAREHHAPMHPTHLRGLGRAFRVGLPLLWRSLTLRVVLMGTTFVAARIGTTELAAFNVSLQIWYILSNLLDALAIAAQAMVGRRLGAGQGDVVHELVRRLTRWTLAYGVLAGFITLLLSPITPHLFSADPEVRRLMTLCLVLVGVHQPLAGMVFLLDGVLIGSGDTRFLAFVLTMGMCTFLPLAWAVLHWDLGVTGLWGAMIGFLLMRVALLWRRSISDAWIIEGATR